MGELKTYKGPLRVKGKLAHKKYTPEEFCELIDACNAGLSTIRAYYKRWGATALTLCEILEMVRDKEDFYFYAGAPVGMSYALSSWGSLIRYLMKAAVRAAVWKQFPYLKKRPRRYCISDLTVTLLESAHTWNLSNNSYVCPFDSMIQREVVYQILYDMAHGLFDFEIELLELEDNDTRSRHDEDNAAYIMVVE